VHELASLYKQLSPIDFRILVGIENEMRRHKWVPIENLQIYTGSSVERLRRRLEFLRGMKIVLYAKTPYEGYQLYYRGYDLLALHTFVKRGTLDAVGGQIGFGKESDVFVGLKNENRVVIKLHRAGMTFKKIKRERRYLADKEHFSWVYASRLAAQHEFKALKILYPEVSVPEPIDQNRHAIVMGLCEGVSLVDCVLKDPEFFFDEIIENTKKTYELGVVHGDLSEYNILVSPDGITIIDWPQWVGREEINADELLLHDLSMICKYFKKKYSIKKDPVSLLNYFKS